MKVLSLTGGEAKAINLFQAAKVYKEKKGQPNIITGTSSGALVAPILAVSYEMPQILDEAIKMAESLSILDMFPYAGNMPVNAKGKVPFSSYLRVATGYNHLGWQDIAPLYKKVFKQHHFEVFKKSLIKCYSFSVNGSDGKMEFNFLNNAKDIDELIALIERSSRIVPLVQNKDGRIDGGFCAFSSGVWFLEKYEAQIKDYVSIYSKPMPREVKKVENWDKNVFTTSTQAFTICTHFLGVKDVLLEQLFCHKYNIDLKQIQCPEVEGGINQMYEVDDEQLRKSGLAARQEAIKILS